MQPFTRKIRAGRRKFVGPTAIKVLSWPYRKAIVGFVGLGKLIDKGKTKLYFYSSKRANEAFEHDTFTQLSSIKGVYPTLTKEIVKCFIERKLPGKHMLIDVTAILQSYGIFDKLMNVGLGGVFLVCL